mmetsp:Transcript_12369/g.22348  ORF Transcript_12369/g.22348 Transcript_12369/m.22348 type:complete len:100 (-) Transcript_12369:288-587(-)
MEATSTPVMTNSVWNTRGEFGRVDAKDDRERRAFAVMYSTGGRRTKRSAYAAASDEKRWRRGAKVSRKKKRMRSMIDAKIGKRMTAVSGSVLCWEVPSI